MNKKNFIGVITLVSLALLLLGVLSWEPKSPDKEFRLGIILPLTGNIASLGEGSKNGAELAYSFLATSTRKQFILSYEDDQFKSQNTVSAFTKLAEVDKVDAIVCFASGPCNAIAPLAEEKHILLIGIASDSSLQKNKKFVFRLEMSPATEAEKLLEHLKIKNYQHIASIVAKQDGIMAGYKSLKKDGFFSSREIAREYVSPEASDFRTIITKLIKDKPDVIFLGLLPGTAGDFSSQARSQGYQGTFVGLNFIEGEETLSTAKGSLEGIVYTNTQTPEDWFLKNYEKIYKKSPGPGSAHLFDLINLVANQIEENKTSQSDLIKYFESLNNYKGALGTFSSNDLHEFTIPIVLKTVKGNRFEKL